MKLNIIHRIFLFSCLCTAIFSACSNEDNNIPIGNNENQENKMSVYIFAGKLARKTRTPVWDTISVEHIKNLDVFIYDQEAGENGIPELHLEPVKVATDTALVFRADFVGGDSFDKMKDVYVVANGDFTSVDVNQLSKKKLETYMQTLDGYTYKSSDGVTERNALIQTASASHIFNDDRVMKLSLKRTYSKVIVKFVYDYKDIAESDSTPRKISVGLKAVNHYPKKYPLFSDINTAFIRDVKSTRLIDDLPFQWKSGPIVSMGYHEDNMGDCVYDTFEGTPYLLVYPNNAKNKEEATSIELRCTLYKDETDKQQSIISFLRKIDIKSIDEAGNESYAVLANTSYIYTIHIDPLDRESEVTCQMVPWNYMYEEHEVTPN